VPAQTDAADQVLAGDLATIPNGAAKRDGVAAGRDEAGHLIAERTGDGLDPASVDAPFQPPAPTAGVWQPTPPQFAPAVIYGARLARPFLLRSADQFRSVAPPALGSARYRTDLAEVRAYGSATSTVRTQAQADTAIFWYDSPVALFNRVLRVAVAQTSRSLTARTRLVGLFNAAEIDGQIANSDGKYAYLRWRPVTAIRSADLDNDPATVADPNWLPLLDTPPDPDYPSGLNTYSGAAVGVLDSVAGDQSPPSFRVTSPSKPGVTRAYTTWKQLSAETVEARVWSGIHSRSADLAGVALGNDVATYAVAHADALFRPTAHS
jgi:hypothetical protein